MNYTVEKIIELNKTTDKVEYLFFWGHRQSDNAVTKSCLSQWYNCRFTVDGVEYSTAEQYMMAQKALLFNDREVFEMIMKATTPDEYKKLGRKIKPFNQEIWDENKYRIVFEGNLAKFSQNSKLKGFLLSTKDKILVEASPYDSIWGIAMSANEPGISDPVNWKGQNLLGFALMEVRDELINNKL